MDEYKISLIMPEDDEYGLKDGEILSFGEMNNDLYHVGLLLEYGLKIYGDDSVFGIIKECQMASVFSYFLAEYFGYVVFLNLHFDKYGKKGLLYLPSDISISQMDSVNKMYRNLKGFEIEVNSDLQFVDGFTYSDKNVYVSDGIHDIFEIEMQKIKAI